jgi:hypothetical protein
MPLDRAAKIIDKDQSFGNQARRRRAIVKVSASAFLARRRNDTTPAELDVYKRALHALRAPRDALTHEFDKLLPGHEVTLSRLVVEQAVIVALNATKGPWDRLCCGEIDWCTVKPADAASNGFAYFHIIVENRPVADLKVAVDPQEWAGCDPPAPRRARRR